MFFTKLKYISYGICISLITTTLVTKAAGLNGVFGDYFTNMTLACPINSVITGFDASGTDYGMRHCSTLQTILGSIFGASTAPTGQAMLGFDASGNPKYGSVNWNNNGSDISYTGSNVGIGTSTPTAKLEVSGGKVALGSTTQDYIPALGNWNYTLQLNSQDTSSIGFHDAGDKVGSIRFKNNLFTIGADDGWGTADLTVAGKIKMQNQTAVTDSADTVVTKGYLENNPVDAPVGAVMPFMLSTCPSGWVAANGANGTLDMRGEFIRGLDSGRGVDAGRVLGSWQDFSMERITGRIGKVAVAGGWDYSSANGAFYFDGDYSWGGVMVGGGNYQQVRMDTGLQAKTSTETRPRNVALLYCQKMVSTASTPSNNVTWTNTTGTNAGNVVQATVGNIGIGTNTPSAKLDVNGNTKISGSIGIGSSGPENTNWGASIHKDDWAVVTRKADGTDNVEPQNPRGSMYTNDIYVRAIGKWVSQIGSSSVPSGTICGMHTRNFNLVSSTWGDTVSTCQGLDPVSSCPSGYTQYLTYGYGSSHANTAWCAKN